MIREDVRRQIVLAVAATTLGGGVLLGLGTAGASGGYTSTINVFAGTSRRSNW